MRLGVLCLTAAVATAPLAGCATIAEFEDEGGDGGPMAARTDGGRDGTTPIDATGSDSRSEGGARRDVVSALDSIATHSTRDANGDVSSACPGSKDVMCSGVCVNTDSDPDNCGGCGHACGATATCSKGLCPVTTYATAQDMPSSVAVHGAKLYWTTANRVSSVAVVGGSTGATMMTVQSDAGQPFAVTASDAGVFWTEAAGSSGFVASVPLTGGGVKTLATGQSSPQGISQAGSTVYWAVAGGIEHTSTGAPGTNSLTTEATAPYAVAATPAAVFFTEEARSVLSSATMSTSASVVFTNDAGTSDFEGVAVDSTQVYWTDAKLGVVAAAAQAGTHLPAWRLSGQSAPVGVASDGTNVYWANSGNGTVLRAAALDGSNVITLAADQTDVWAVAVDDTRVYWVTKESSGVVAAVVK